MDIESLIDGCRKGQTQALGELYKRYSEQMFGVCYRYVGVEDSARDVLHDAFIHIFSAIKQFHSSDEVALKAWLRRIMTTESLVYLRNHRIEHSVIPIEDLPEDDSLISESDAESIPEEVLMDMVTHLPEGYRTVFNMYVFESYTHKQIGEKLGINEKSSSSQYYRAKCLLAKQIKEYLNRDGQ